MITVTLQWNRNMESDLSGYNAYRSQVSGGPYSKINAQLIPQTGTGIKPTYQDTVTDGTYYYVVTAVNALGLESGFSNEVVVSAPPPQPPAPPTGLTATITANVVLAVDSSPVASANGPLPLNLNYVLPKTTPPRDRRLTVRVAS